MEKKSLFAFLILILAFSMLAACGGGQEPAPTPAEDGDTATDESPETGEATEDKQVYTVAVDNNYQPFEFLDEATGEMVGFDIDLINAIADEAGFEITIEDMEFDGVVAGIASGRYDIGIAGMTITEERKESIDFSRPYYQAGLILAVRADETEIQSADDLAGKTVATRSGTTSESYVIEQTEGEPMVFPNIVEAYQTLISGRADAALYDVPNVLYYIKTDEEQRMKSVGTILQGEEYGIAFPKGSELRDVADEALSTLMDNGTYGDIYEEWFGERPEGM